MNFWFEMAINAVEVTLILSFLVQYFGYRMACPAKYIWTALFGVLSFGSVAFFSWGQLYEGYASSIQILINIAFCCADQSCRRYLFLHLRWALWLLLQLLRHCLSQNCPEIMLPCCSVGLIRFALFRF